MEIIKKLEDIQKAFNNLPIEKQKEIEPDLKQILFGGKVK
jgi:hypothetical protein